MANLPIGYHEREQMIMTVINLIHLNQWSENYLNRIDSWHLLTTNLAEDILYGKTLKEMIQ